MQSDQNQIKLLNLLKPAKRNVSWQNITTRSEKSDHKTDSQSNSSACARNAARHQRDDAWLFA